MYVITAATRAGEAQCSVEMEVNFFSHVLVVCNELVFTATGTAEIRCAVDGVIWRCVVRCGKHVGRAHRLYC